VLRSGLHPTLAGVALAFTVPLRRTPARSDDRESPLHVLEHALQAWVAFLIVPIFGFANSGVSLAGMDSADKGELHAAPLSAKRLLALWNALPGVAKSGGRSVIARRWSIGCGRRSRYCLSRNRNPT
jgi:hypothetical protein